jgi:hypothetical protein
MTDVSVGDAVYVLNCTGGGNPTAYQVGATSITRAVTPTSPTSLTVFYPNSGPDDSTGATVCELQNNSGHPLNSVFANNTLLTPNGEQIISGGTWKQSYNNLFAHNIFAAPAGTTSFGITCSHINGEGNTALSQCWDAGSLREYDNLIVNQSNGTPPAVLCSGNNCWTEVWPAGSTANLSPNSDCPGGPTAACMGWTGFTATGGSGKTFPTGVCSYDGSNPLDCPLMGAPWASNFSLNDLVPLSGSSYVAEGANISAINSAMTRMKYVCQTPCGSGPYLDSH